MSFRGRSAGRFCAWCDAACEMARSAAVTVTPEPRTVSLAHDIELACRFAKGAEFAPSVAVRDLERSVCGCHYGSTSWTTRREAERITQLLELWPTEGRLDVGRRVGMAGALSCASRRLRRRAGGPSFRATADSISQRCEAVAADGAVLQGRFIRCAEPFRCLVLYA